MSNLHDVRTGATRCAVCPIRERALFQVVPMDYIHDAERKRTGQYQLLPRHHLYEEGEPASMAYTLFDGWMLLYRVHSDGGRQGLRIALPGDFIGYMPPGESTFHHSAVANTPVTLCGFRQHDLHDMLDSHPNLAIHIARIHTRYMVSCQAAMLGLGRKSAEQRIAYLIAELFYRLNNRGLTEGDSLEMAFPITQEMLGDMSGLTPVHTNRVMRKLHLDGLIRVERQRLTILDMPRLKDIGEFSNTKVE